MFSNSLSLVSLLDLCLKAGFINFLYSTRYLRTLSECDVMNKQTQT